MGSEIVCGVDQRFPPDICGLRGGICRCALGCHRMQTARKAKKISLIFSLRRLHTSTAGVNKYDSNPIHPKDLEGLPRKWGAIVVGGGHNGLVAAAYLAKHGVKDVLVLERRHLVGGAAVTEELVPGFKFSRGSYLAGLLRPRVIDELELVKHGMKYLPRDPSSFTPSLLNGPNNGKYLLLGSNADDNWRSIAQFSERDADEYPKYEEFLQKAREIVQPLLDASPTLPFEAHNNWKDNFRSTQLMLQVA